jgi:hypothetical protein
MRDSGLDRAVGGQLPGELAELSVAEPTAHAPDVAPAVVGGGLREEQGAPNPLRPPLAAV